MQDSLGLVSLTKETANMYFNFQNGTRKSMIVVIPGTNQVPDLPSLQEAFFNSGMVCYNESYCPAGKSSLEEPDIHILWNEAISARDAADVASALWKFCEILDARIQKEKPGSRVDLVLWMDNCGPQVIKFLLFFH